MRLLSVSELNDLGEKFSIEIDPQRAENIITNVNTMLAEIDSLDKTKFNRNSNIDDKGERSWKNPTSDEFNAINVECNILPSNEGLLSGYTVGIKDIISVADVPMECGSSVMRGFIPSSDATVISRLRAEGASIVAKTNCDEFAGSARGTTGLGLPIKNPADKQRTAGGSSGGSAVAVATDKVQVALGTDTGGSVRIPASFCGVIGLKPTYGLIPLTGIVENTYTLDHVGIFASNVVDTAKTLDVIVGDDDSDLASMAASGKREYTIEPYVETVTNETTSEDLKIGILENGLEGNVSSQVITQTEDAIRRLENIGISTTRVRLENFHTAKPIKNTLSTVELAAHWRDGAVPYRRGTIDESYQAAFSHSSNAASGELNDFYMSKLIAGARLIEAHGGRHYVRAQTARDTLATNVSNLLNEVDVLLLPTMPGIAPKIENVAEWEYDFARNTRLANVTKHPAITIPNGTINDLPIGLQLIGSAFDEAKLLDISRIIKKNI